VEGENADEKLLNVRVKPNGYTMFLFDNFNSGGSSFSNPKISCIQPTTEALAEDPSTSTSNLAEQTNPNLSEAVDESSPQQSAK